MTASRDEPFLQLPFRAWTCGWKSSCGACVLVLVSYFEESIRCALHSVADVAGLVVMILAAGEARLIMLFLVLRLENTSRPQRESLWLTSYPIKTSIA